MQKPDKVYLEISNLAYALRGNEMDVDSVRELFFYDQMRQVAKLQYCSEADFFVNDRYLFEIGGRHKRAAIAKGFFIVNDGIDHGAGVIFRFGYLGYFIKSARSHPFSG